MKDFSVRQVAIIISGIIAMLLPISTLTFGRTLNTNYYHSPFLILAELTSQDKLQQYKEDIQQQFKKAHDLIQELENKIDTRSQGNQDTLRRNMMELNKELEHAQRMYRNFDTIDPKNWLREKREVDAVMASLDEAYDDILPNLHDKTRYLQEAVHHAKLAKNFAEEERNDLFLKNSEKAKEHASLAQQAGIDSEFVAEGISELKDAIYHINEDKVGAATTLIGGAYLQLHSAFKQHMDRQ